MNKKELIERINKLPCFEGPIAVTVTVNREWILKSIEQLDEPQKVKVPEFVNKYIQEAREYNWDLQDLLKYIDDEHDEKLSRWFYHDYNQETLALAWINGYEIEQEERYLVKMKGIRESDAYLNHDSDNKKWYFDNRINGNTVKSYHTREELESSGFSWVFDCPGIEVKEVVG